jgi:hypothetical protein
MLKFALLLVLCIVQADRVIDTRLEDAEELNVYLTMGEHLTLILGGSAGTGGKWFYGFTN